MKKTAFHNIILLLFITALCACKPDGLQLYEKKPDVYFTYLVNESGAAPRSNDSVIVKFAYILADVVVVEIPLSVSGRLSNLDRDVKIAINPESTAEASKHYLSPIQAKIRAGKSVDTLTVALYRSDLNQDTEPRVLILDLEPNQNFGTDFRSILNLNTQQERILITYKIYVSDIEVQPARWLEFYLGTFSVKKLHLICQLTGFLPAFFDGQPNEEGKTMQTWDIRSAAAITKVYLETEAAAGRTVYEDPDNKVPMTMGQGT
jgi:hypothetical protein